jgi:hypothetical protein
MDSATSHLALIWMASIPAGSRGYLSVTPEEPTNCSGVASSVLNRGPWAIPDRCEQGVFWSEPVSQSGLRTRSLFDKKVNVVPVISVFDNSPKWP